MMKRNIFIIILFCSFFIFVLDSIYSMKAGKANRLSKSLKKSKKASSAKKGKPKSKKKISLSKKGKNGENRKKGKPEKDREVKKIEKKIKEEVKKKIKEKEAPSKSLFLKIFTRFKKKKISPKEKAKITSDILKSSQFKKELEDEIKKELTWKMATDAGVAVKLKDFDHDNWKVEVLKDEYKLAEIKMNLSREKYGQDSNEYKKSKEVVDKLEKEINDSQNKLKEEKDKLIVALQEKGLDFDIDVALKQKTAEQEKLQMKKELEVAGVILSKPEFEKKLQDQEKKIKDLEAKIAKVEAMNDQGGMAYGQKLRSWRDELIKERQKALGLKYDFFTGGDIGKLVKLEQRNESWLRGIVRGYSVVWTKDQEKLEKFKNKIYDKMYTAKGLKDENIDLLNAKLKASATRFDKQAMKKELEDPSLPDDQKKEIKRELEEIRENEQIVKEYLDKQVDEIAKNIHLNDLKKEQVRQILDEELTKKAERLQEIDSLVEEAKRDYIGNKKSLKTEKRKMAFIMLAMGGGVMPTLFFDPVSPSLLEEQEDGESQVLTQEEIDMIKSRRAIQAK